VAGANVLFRLPINWRVGGGNAGFIVQRIQRNEKYWVPGLGANAGEFYRAVCAFEYWEAWEITAPGGRVTVSPSLMEGGAEIHDVFAVNSMMRLRHKGMAIGNTTIYPDKPGTRGRWKIRGTVYHVPVLGFDLANWHRSKAADPAGAPTGDVEAVDNAGRLLSRFDAPIRGNGLSAMGVLGNEVCTRKFAGTWDWSAPVDRHTGVRPPPISAHRYYPLGGNFDTPRCVLGLDPVVWVDAMGAA
jgi:hypothetical protein